MWSMFFSMLKSSALNWVLIIAVSYFAIDNVRDYVSDKWQSFTTSKDKANYLKAENERLAIESNQQLKKKELLIKALEEDAKAREAEIKWSIDRQQKLERKVNGLKNENAELKRILDSRIPVSLIE